MGAIPEEKGAAAEKGRRGLNLIDWPELDRALWLLGFCIFYTVVAGLILSILPHTTAAPYLDRRAVELSFWLNLGMGILWTTLLGFGLYARKRRRPYRPIVWALSVSYAIFFSTVVYFLGLYSTPLWLMLAAGLMLALLLLDRVIVHTGALVAAFSLAVITAGENSGILPHAPLFTRPPYTPDGRLDPTWNGVMTFASWLLLLIVWVIGDRLVTRWKEREERLKLLSTVDPLTGLANRRHFMEVMRRECGRAERTGRPISLLMFDADDFKQINDEHGHAVGDEVLIGLAGILLDGVRAQTDLVGRIGGEEFAVLLPEADLAAAVMVAQRICRAAEAHVFEVGDLRLRVTFSGGAASSTNVGPDPTALLHAADAMLYRSKRAGRNRVSFAEAG